MMNERQERLFKIAFTPMPGEATAPLTPAATAAAAAPGVPPVPGPSAMPPAVPDPAAAAPGMPAEPQAMAASMPPGQPQQSPVSTGDMVIDMLLEMGVVMLDGQTGTPIPPEAISQIVTEMANQLGQGGGVPPGQPAEPTSEAAAGDSSIMAVLEALAQLDSNVSVLRDKIDSLRNIVEDNSPEHQVKSAEADSDGIDAEVQKLLDEQAARGNVQTPAQGIPNDIPVQAPGVDPNSPEMQLQLLQAMQNGQL